MMEVYCQLRLQHLVADRKHPDRRWKGNVRADAAKLLGVSSHTLQEVYTDFCNGEAFKEARARGNRASHVKALDGDNPEEEGGEWDSDDASNDEEDE